MKLSGRRFVSANSTHEDFSRDEVVIRGSDRSFGFVMAGGFAVLSILNFWHAGRVWPYMLLVAAFFALSGLLYPALLGPLNRAWFKFGLLLHKVINPIIMGLVFYGAVLPTGLIARALGKDLLRLKLQPKADSYWIIRQPPGPAANTMTDQF